MQTGCGSCHRVADDTAERIATAFGSDLAPGPTSGMTNFQTSGNAVILTRPVWPSLAFTTVAAAGFGLRPLAPGRYGSGIRNLSRWIEPQATFQGIDATITYLGPQGVVDNLVQVNI